MPSLPAVVSSCCIRIKRARSPSNASNVLAILSDMVCRKALCSTLNAMPDSTAFLTFAAKSSCLMSGLMPAMPVMSLVNLSQ